MSLPLSNGALANVSGFARNNSLAPPIRVALLWRMNSAWFRGHYFALDNASIRSRAFAICSAIGYLRTTSR